MTWGVTKSNKAEEKQKTRPKAQIQPPEYRKVQTTSEAVPKKVTPCTWCRVLRSGFKVQVVRIQRAGCGIQDSRFRV